MNYALGLTDVRLRDFILASFIGMLPGTFLYVYLGSLVSNVASLSAGGDAGGAAQRFVYWAGLGATVAVTIYVTRMARGALQTELGHA